MNIIIDTMLLDNAQSNFCNIYFRNQKILSLYLYSYLKLLQLIFFSSIEFYQH